MNISYEEIYLMYGQFDTFVILEFKYNSEEYNLFGNRLMGVFFYTMDERQKLEEILKLEEIPRNDSKIKFSPSTIEKLTGDNVELLDRYGIQASSIRFVSSFDKPRKNRFAEKGLKEIPRQLIQAPEIDGWQELNRLRFGFLNAIYKSKQPFSPYQEIEYWGLRKHLELGTNLEDYLKIMKEDGDIPFLKNVRLVELDCKFQELSIQEEDIKEFAKLKIEKILYKKHVIENEIEKSGENIKNVSKHFESEIEELKKCCYSFEEDIIGFGEKPIYLTFERFVHIYARHVSETQIGERFSGKKTVFQYKFDNIKYLLKMVLESIDAEIEDHFKENPDKQFRRMGVRAIYIDGHYYKLVIEPNGSILDFHPYNQNE